MGYLNKKTVYLCGSITALADDGQGWRNTLTPTLEGYGLIVDDPTKTTSNNVGEVGDNKLFFRNLVKERNFELLKKEFFPIVRKDLRSVDKADFLICSYDPEVHLVGTIHELVVASLQRKPILLHCEDSKLDKLNPWILTFVKNGCMFTDWNKMLEYLHEIDNHNFNTSYWTL
jgi:hypothetical protein